MITRLKNRLSRFRKEESGAAYTVEFVIMLPLLFVTFAFGVELTTHSNRHSNWITDLRSPHAPSGSTRRPSSPTTTSSRQSASFRVAWTNVTAASASR